MFSIGIDNLPATSGTANKEVSRQNYLALLQLAGQVSQQVIQLAQVGIQGQGTPLAEIAQHAITAQVTLFRRVLEQYDERDIDAILPSPAGQAAGPQPQAVGAPVPAGPVGGAGAAPPPASIDPQLAALFGGTVSGL